MEKIAPYTWLQFLIYCKEQADHFECFEHLINNLQTKLRSIPYSDSFLIKRFQNLQENATGPYDTYVCIDEPSCKLMLILLQADAEIGLHNHPNQSGIIFCHQGSVQIDAFDEISETPPNAILQKVYSKNIGAGESAFLTPNRANIHSLSTTKLTMLIDIFIPPPKEENKELCRSYTIQKNPAYGDLYQAKIN